MFVLINNMITKKWPRVIQKYYDIHYKCYCTKVLPNTQETVTEIVDIPPPRSSNSHRSRIYYFFKNNEKLESLKKYIPSKYIRDSLKPTDTKDLYLICPDIAKRIANIILKDLDIPNRNDHIICESNPGIGMIAQELLDGGLQSIRLYEGCADFRVMLKDFSILYAGRVELFQKDIFNMPAYTFMDKQDNGHRIEDMLRDIPKKDWLDEPALTIVGVISCLNFIRYLNRSLALQFGLMTWGRVQIYAVMRNQDVMILRSKNTDRLSLFKPVSILFQSFCDMEVLETFPRKMFLPWLKKDFGDMYRCHYGDVNLGEMHLVKISSKKTLPLPREKLMAFYYFILQTYAKKGNALVIPTLEKWISGIGESLITSTSSELKNQPDDIGVFTKLRDLTLEQLIAVFKVVTNHPNYDNSIFERIIENEQIRNVTIETDMHESYEMKARKKSSNKSDVNKSL